VAKGHRGLPPDFSLDIPDRPKPVELNDYLDEVEARPVRQQPARQQPEPQRSKPEPESQAPSPAPPPESKVVEMPRQQGEPASKPAAKQEQDEPRPKAKKRRTPKPPPRRQINMSPETQRMVDELIDYVQTYGVQKDAKGSEVFHGLVLALYESLEHVDLSNVPARGRWGTPTAQAFPINLKSAFKAAIAESFNRKNRRK